MPRATSVRATRSCSIARSVSGATPSCCRGYSSPSATCRRRCCRARRRIRVSFLHQAPGPAALIVKAKLGAPTGDAARPRPPGTAHSWEPPPPQGRPSARALRARHQDRDSSTSCRRRSPTRSASITTTRVARRRGQVPQRRPDRQQGVPAVGPDPRHRTGPEGRDRHRRAAQGRGIARATSRWRRIRKWSSRTSRRSRRPVGAAPAGRDLYRAAELPARRRRARVRAQPRPPCNAVVLPRGWYVTWLSIPAVVRQTPEA